MDDREKDFFQAMRDAGESEAESLKELMEAQTEEAGEELDNYALEVATGKEFNGTRTYMILLGTGGPASRIIGDLDEHDQPETAVYQFQDWFQPWTNYNANNEEGATFLQFAQRFYFEGV